MSVDSRTRRKPGDHGTAEQAIEFALDGRHHDHDAYNQLEFLKAWQQGNAFEEWPEFYSWLADKERRGKPISLAA